MDMIKKVKKAIEKKQNDIVGFICDLIRSKPVNPIFCNNENSEQKCQRIIESRLKSIGLQVEQIEPSLKDLAIYSGSPGYTNKASFEGRPNIFSKLPGTDINNGLSLLLAGHADVIGVDLKQEQWDYDPWDALIKNDLLYGRGSVDMLSGLGCMVMAIETLCELDVPLLGDVWFSSVVGEESGGMGMLALANNIFNKKLKIDAGIMGEPTDLHPSLLCRGIIWGRIILKGRSGHIEIKQPHWKNGGAIDAIHKIRFLMDAIDELNYEWYTRANKNHKLLEDPCQVRITKIKGGHHGSSYAEHCEIDFNIQFLPKEADQNGLGTKVKNEFEIFIQRVSDTDPWLRIHNPKIEYLLEADCAEVGENHPIVKTIKESCSLIQPVVRLTGSGFHTDIGWLSRLCKIPTINFGPGNPALAHHSNEYVNIYDLVKVTQIIAITCIKWCNLKKN